MRVAVISDIHGNFYALTAVLAAIDDEAVDEVWCLGDVVGYGPRPGDCCALVRGRASLCLAGNHDLGVLGRLDLGEFSPDAAHAAAWTRSVLAEPERDFLESLSPSAARPGVELFHASARDPVWEYVLTEEAAEATLRLTSAGVVLVGHSHVALAIEEAEGRVGGGIATPGTEIALGDRRWLLNPGSVGQPRDHDRRAAYLVLDLDARRAVYRRVDYDVERTQAEIREAGLPAVLAERLAHGL